MGVKDVILLALSAALVIVGTHITLTQGILVSYPVFMFAVALLFWFKFRKARHLEKRAQKYQLPTAPARATHPGPMTCQRADNVVHRSAEPESGSGHE